MAKELTAQTHLSHYTNEELLRRAYQDPSTDSETLVVELCVRLQQLLDEHDAWDGDDGANT